MGGDGGSCDPWTLSLLLCTDGPAISHQPHNGRSISDRPLKSGQLILLGPNYFWPQPCQWWMNWRQLSSRVVRWIIWVHHSNSWGLLNAWINRKVGYINMSKRSTYSILNRLVLVSKIRKDAQENNGYKKNETDHCNFLIIILFPPQYMTVC